MNEASALWDLFVTFLLIGAVSFGGGYAMIPVIEREVVHRHEWLTLPAFTDVVGVAGMSPGPIATNTAIFVGYRVAGVPGAIVSSLGTILPSLSLVLIAAAFFYKVRKNELVKRGFYGLRPIIAGLIFYAAFSFALGNGLFPAGADAVDWGTAGLLAIFALSFIGLLRYRIHPVFIVILSGLAGIALFS